MVTIHSLDILLSQFGTSPVFMSCSNCCFLTCIQISLVAGKVFWYSHVLRNFPQFVVIHTVKGLCSWVLSFSVSTVHEESSGFKGFGISQRQTVSYLFAKEFLLISLLGGKSVKYMPDPFGGSCHLGGRNGWSCSRFYCLNRAGKLPTGMGDPRSSFCP